MDTHVAVWLHDGLVRKLTQAAKSAIEASELRISPMVYLELEYLFKRGRIRIDAPKTFANLSTTFGVTICPFPFPAIVGLAVDCDWTSDPFDRIIVGHAKANHNSSLITADEAIRENYPPAVW